MPLVNAKCTNCGATLTVDNDKETAICQYCNSAFIVEKAINNYKITNNINASVVNIYGSNTDNNRDFVIEAGKLISYKGSSADVVIPDEVFLIGRNAFTKSTIRSITFHKGKLEIEESKIISTGTEAAFYGCPNLVTLVIPGNIKKIPDLCFAHCENLKTLVVEEGVETIGVMAFSMCENLKTVSLPKSLSEIGNHAFSSCSSFESITIPKNVRTIRKRTFDSCSSLSNVVIEKGVESIEECAFIGCSSLKSIHFPESMKKVNNQALLSCDNLEEITSDNSDLPTDNISKNYQRHEGCYIATAVYGSYDCPQVWTLRRYRDDILAKTWHGRVFIRMYYAISPTLVKWFGKTNWFKNLWKPKLDRMVSRLIIEGFSSKQYYDNYK
jgi:DNA-directed RNA polymerase subunit RPC12/RpoP